MKRFLAVILCALSMTALFAGCGKKGDDATAGGKTPAVADIYDAVVKEIGENNMPKLEAGNAETIKQFYGLEEKDMVEASFHMPLMNVQADEIFIAKVNPDSMATVEAGIEKRKIDLDTTWKQYLPEVYEIVKKAQTVKNGDYIMFVVSENVDAAVKAFNAQTK